MRYNTYKTLIYENLFLENLYLEIFKEDIQKHIQDNIQDILHKLDKLIKIYPTNTNLVTSSF